MKVRLPKGYGGGGGNMNQMIRQAQKAQEQMEAKQQELAEREFNATVGGGVVQVVMTGDKAIQSITINPEIVDPEDVEMLQDLIIAAVNEVYRNVDETTDAEMAEITGSLGLPGML